MDTRYAGGFKKAGYEQLKVGEQGSLETSHARGQGLPRAVTPEDEEEHGASSRYFNNKSTK